ncbi:MAG: hypothetical protein PHN39_02135, partial [Candidatus Pacebacteria bacterium]|nr:hypothetical protein [Candidatus Paceibacterota bacterium]
IYVQEIKADGATVALDKSDNFFTITAIAPSVTVISPNGGETIKTGDSFAIKFKASGLSSTSKLKIYACTDSTLTPVCSLVDPNSLLTSSLYYMWTVPLDFFNRAGMGSSGDKFKIQVSEILSNGNTGIWDRSDNAFSLVSSATSSSCPVPILDLKNGYYNAWISSSVHPPVGWQKEYPAFKSFLDMLLSCQQITKDEYNSQCSYYHLDCAATSLKIIENGLANIAAQIQALMMQMGR